MNASVEGSSRIGVFRIATPAVVATVGAVLVQCTSPPPPPPATSSPSVARPAPAVPAPPASAPPARPAATVHPVTATELGASWRPGCPLEPGRLRRVEINYIGFDGETHRGALIVHEDLVTEVIAIFEQLHQLRYPIEKIRAVNDYPGAHDELSMEDNNTSAFNCRGIPGTPPMVSARLRSSYRPQPAAQPVINRTGAFQPKNAAPYLDRNSSDPGLLHDGDPAVHVFTDRGWRWGGSWRTSVDYQHFER